MKENKIYINEKLYKKFNLINLFHIKFLSLFYFLFIYFFLERMSSTTFPAYRDHSSSSLTTSSGSSLASSAGGLHMHAPTPPTPIPVMITGPDDSPRRESINCQVDHKLATFYTTEEVVN